MDPASAIGIAAGALAFLDFSLKVLATCREIKEDAEHATKFNKALEQDIKAVQDHRKVLEHSLSQPGCKRRLLEVCRGCTQDAEELLKLLVSLRDVSGKPMSIVKAAIKTISSKRTVERLQNGLKAKEDKLNSLLIQDLHSTIDQLRLGQDSASHSSNQSVDRLAKQVQNVQLNTSQMLQEQRLQALLDSLHFPEMDYRHGSVKKPYLGTAQWVFDRGRQKPDHTALDHDFTHWLRQADGNADHTYWICGKAASGKSTLMAHIINDKRTCVNLQKWAGPDRPVHILSHFFWKAGTLMQRSLIGLLRTIAYQLLSIPLYAKSAVAADHGRYSWTVRALLDLIGSALQDQQNVRCCIFIDGLDEYEGDSNDVFDALTTLKMDSVKLCISSRPEWQLKRELEQHPKLVMEDHNRTDIHALVSGKLLEHKQTVATLVEDKDSIEELIFQIVDRASGMFLWAVLVSNSVVKGLLSGDEWNVLKARVQHTPSEMGSLFKAMLDAVEDVQKPLLYWYFRIMTFMTSIEHEASIALLTYLRLPESMRESWTAFIAACQQTELQIVAQSAGLLEVHRYPTDPDDHLGVNQSTSANVAGVGDDNSSKKVLWRRFDSTAHASSDAARPRCAGTRLVSDAEYSALRESIRSNIRWVHRSALDYVTERDFQPWEATGNRTTTYKGLASQCFEGAIDCMSHLPNISGLKFSNTFLKLAISCIARRCLDAAAFDANLARLSSAMEELSPWDGYEAEYNVFPNSTPGLSPAAPILEPLIWRLSGDHASNCAIERRYELATIAKLSMLLVQRYTSLQAALASQNVLYENFEALGPITYWTLGYLWHHVDSTLARHSVVMAHAARVFNHEPRFSEISVLDDPRLLQTQAEIPQHNIIHLQQDDTEIFIRAILELRWNMQHIIAKIQEATAATLQKMSGASTQSCMQDALNCGPRSYDRRSLPLVLQAWSRAGMSTDAFERIIAAREAAICVQCLTRADLSTIQSWSLPTLSIQGLLSICQSAITRLDRALQDMQVCFPIQNCIPQKPVRLHTSVQWNFQLWDTSDLEPHQKEHLHMRLLYWTRHDRSIVKTVTFAPATVKAMLLEEETFHLDKSMSLQASFQKLLCHLARIHELLRTDIWQVQKGMNASDQLFALASLRCGLPACFYDAFRDLLVNKTFHVQGWQAEMDTDRLPGLSKGDSRRALDEEHRAVGPDRGSSSSQDSARHSSPVASSYANGCSVADTVSADRVICASSFPLWLRQWLRRWSKVQIERSFIGQVGLEEPRNKRSWEHDGYQLDAEI